MTDQTTDPMQFEGRVYIVTGSGQGIGRDYALSLSRRGARVVVNDIGTGLLGGGTSAAPAEEVVGAIQAEGGVAIVNTDSVATSEGCAALVRSTIEGFGRLDGLIHNASVHPSSAPVAEFVDEDLERTFAVHLHGAFHLTRATWPHLAERGGRILFITSAVGLWGHRHIAPYAAAKTGVVGLARVVAHDGEEVGITANVLSVGAATRASMRSLDSVPATRAWWEKYLDAGFVAAAGTWLVHPDCPASGRLFDAFGGRMSEIVFAETEGCTQLDWTAEDYRDRFGQITDRSALVPIDRSSEWQRLGLRSILAAGADELVAEDGMPAFLREAAELGAGR